MVCVHQVDSLCIAYRSRGAAPREPTLPRFLHRLQPWRMNLVTASHRLLQDHRLIFIAVENKVYVKFVHCHGPSATRPPTILEMPVPPPEYLAQLETASTEAVHEDRLINCLTVGRIGAREFLAVADEVGQVAIWDLERLASGPVRVIRTTSSTWSLSFSDRFLMVGCNRHDVMIYEALTGRLVVHHRSRHAHNIPGVHLHVADPGVDHRKEVLFEAASVSIDGTFLYTQIASHARDERMIREEMVSLGQWGWTVTRIRAVELESERDYGQIQLGFRCKRSVSYASAKETSVDQSDNLRSEWIVEVLGEERRAQLREQATEQPTYVLDEEEGWPLGERSESFFASSDSVETDDVESDTAILNRERRQRIVERGVHYSGDELFTVHDVDDVEVDVDVDVDVDEDEDWDERESFVESKFTVTSDRALGRDDTTLYAVTSISELFLITTGGCVLLRIPLPALVPMPPSPLMPNNRYNMSQWIPALSLLVLGNQAGHLLLLHLVVTGPQGLISAQAAVVPRSSDAILAGFVAYPMDDGEWASERARVWHLYILFLDGSFMDVRIERRLQGILDLANLSLCSH